MATMNLTETPSHGSSSNISSLQSRLLTSNPFATLEQLDEGADDDNEDGAMLA